MSEPSIFTKIINGDIPCDKVHEDEYSLAFMDIHPIQPGQVLVVPKKQVEYIWNLETEDYHGLMAAVQKVGQRLQEMYPEAARVGVMVQGLEVGNHAHVKVFPFSTADEYYNRPNESAEPDYAVLKQQAEKLRF
jgi:histidine triad (HIT) family protein